MKTQAAVKLISQEGFKNENSTTLQKVDNTLTAELFFGICSPIGSLKENVIETLKYNLFVKYGYTVEVIKLSEFINSYKVDSEDEKEIIKEPGKSRIFNDYLEKISKGNIIRKNQNNTILAELAIQEIHLSRLREAKENGIDEPKSEDFKSRRKCYIIDSLKTTDELKLLRKVYTDNFYQISVFSSLNDRKENLKNKGFSPEEIVRIIEIDDKQNLEYGQNVRGTFVDGDFFVRISEENIPDLNRKIERYLNLIFESAIVTPTIEELSMYNAKSASGNSACLSRQVGACIIDSNNNLLSTGWNDVPKYGGNLYSSSGTSLDNRCYNKGYCSNDAHKERLVENIIDGFLTNDKIKAIFKDDNGDLKDDLLNEVKKSIKDTKVKDLIEFSRSVHAEMHAIIQGSQTTGDKMIGGKLFCTTYPCHNCARHIVAAGIEEVYFIEPYVKSLCLTLHSDSMTENEKETNKVKILMFDGVAPRRYLTFFTNFAERKDKKGKLIRSNYKNISPKTAKSLQALSTLEQQAVHSLAQNYEKTPPN
ncbi:anti-phage dCTP deaminase [Chryseobacterium oryctis]|uniref:Anti-phage dCTP deaminase n=1 Tax=Chryseobacterium oryctis TaxID=2952618 RepID=A0ABT3HM01_9FLAO|nr:anti-phage dCTP deaminase [Chryseobacterium oryctis]MCW3160818.1 anti-phage dCTP deaminase [Chryseobacterium oryctis]